MDKEGVIGEITMEKLRVVKEYSSVRQYVIEPGDATRYTVFYRSPMGSDDPPFVAIGAGDRIEGGYSMPNLLDRLIVLKRVAWNRGDMIVELKSYADYWKAHSHVENDWTCIVAILFAAMIDVLNMGTYSYGLIHAVYHGEHEKVYSILARGGV